MSLVLDTSAILAFLNRADPAHAEIGNVFVTAQEVLCIPIGVMAEIGYLVETRLGQRALGLFLQDIEQGNFVLDCGLADVPRVRALVARYADLPLGYADAVVIACAEREGYRVVSLDKRHFNVVGREIGLVLLP